jgi:acetyl-CoA carboxylase carboxyltransferase component
MWSPVSVESRLAGTDADTRGGLGEPGEAMQPALHLSGSRGGSPRYHLIPVEAGRQPFLSRIFAAFDIPVLHVWTEETISAATFDRACNGGITTAIAECDGRQVAIAWSDFRVNGASYGRSTASRFSAFLRHLRDSGGAVPLIYVVNSAGVSVMEGRTAFSAAFGIWPELLRYSEEHPVFTCAVGKCLGLAPLLFGLGHYRVGVAHGARLNLTGPDVLRMFFGRAGSDFEQRASAERCMERHDLVHEMVPSTEAALVLFRQLLAGSPAAEVTGTGPEAGAQTRAVLERFLDDRPRELVPGWCPRVRLFMGTRRGCPVGVFVNPLERSDNLINVRTLDKYAAGLDLFRALRLPIISVLDSPGIDPRFDQSDANNIRRIVSVGEKIIRYPYGAMGVVAGRAFGGATTLGFPRVFGGTRAVALRGAQIGVMDDRIVAQLLNGTPRLLAQWQETVAARGREFDDLLAEGSLDAVIDITELAAEVDRFLLQTGHAPPAMGLRLMAGGASAWLGVGAPSGELLEVAR